MPLRGTSPSEGGHSEPSCANDWIWATAFEKRLGLVVLDSAS
jgi:hypothetical protein